MKPFKSLSMAITAAVIAIASTGCYTRTVVSEPSGSAVVYPRNYDRYDGNYGPGYDPRRENSGRQGYDERNRAFQRRGYYDSRGYWHEYPYYRRY